MTPDPRWIVPEWPAAPRVRAFVTTRDGGVSSGEYASMNLAMSSGDDAASVRRNRDIVRAHLPSEPRYMKQVHGAEVTDLDATLTPALSQGRGSDAFVTSAPGTVACVLTADCMPLFVADRAGKRVAVAHAGWRGMAAGVIENTVAAIGGEPDAVFAWMGPTIGPSAFEVGEDVLQAFVAADARAREAFVPRTAPGKYSADLYAIARMRLARAGVTKVFGGGFCTFTESERFFSYRRARQSGRMGAFIWIAP